MTTLRAKVAIKSHMGQPPAGHDSITGSLESTVAGFESAAIQLGFYILLLLHSPFNKERFNHSGPTLYTTQKANDPNITNTATHSYS